MKSGAAALLERIRRAPVTALLSLGSVALYAAMLARGHLEGHSVEFTVGTVVRFGALDPRHAWTGQPWRLLTAGLVHLGPLHLAFDAWALWLLGPRLERLLTPARTLMLVLGAQLGCSSASLLFGDLTVRGGASGIAFGMMGALLVAAVRARSLGSAQRAELVTMGVIALGFSLLPEIDLLGHLGGLAGGAAVMAGVEPSEERGRERALSLLFACVLVALAAVLAVRQPNRANWNVVQAIARYEAGDYRGAVPFLERARDLNDGDYAPAYVDHDLGTCLLQIGERRRALAALSRAADEGSAEAALILGDNEDDPHRALQAYARALALEPEQRPPREAVLRGALAFTDEGQLPDAFDLAALDHLPRTDALLPVELLLATAKLRTGDRSGLRELAPRSDDAKQLLAAADSAGGQPAVAEVLVRALRRLEPGAFETLDAGR